MDRELQHTADGSHTLFVPALNEHYHSVNGALQESLHIFIQAGLQQLHREEINLLEVGFGTGLNALLTLRESEAEGSAKINYHTVELYPLAMEEVRQLNYGSLVWPGRGETLFEALHEAAWEQPISLTSRFVLHKIEGDVAHCPLPTNIHLIYFDAFAPDKQPELWSQELFNRLYAHTAPGGIIVTYCAKGEVRRRMQTAGFTMSRLPGPPGKRHILRGEKAQATK